MIPVCVIIPRIIFSIVEVCKTKTESPIEAALCFALYSELGYRRGEGRYRDSRCPELRSLAGNSSSAWVFTQHPIDRFRADILIVAIPALGSPKRLIVECDGHDFHTSAEQLARDQWRDAIIRASDYDLIRFTGSQINNRVAWVMQRIAMALGWIGEEICVVTGRLPQTKRLDHHAETTLRDAEAGRLVDRFGYHEAAEVHRYLENPETEWP